MGCPCERGHPFFMDASEFDKLPYTAIPPITAPAAIPAIDAPANTVIEISGADLAAPLAASMPLPTSPNGTVTSLPPITTGAPDAIKPPVTFRDKRGRPFNPTRHAIDEKGNPRFNVRGNFISNSVGRPGGAKSKIADADAPDAASTATDFINKGEPDIYDTAAEMYLGIGFGVAAGLLTDDIRPENKQESDALKIPLAAGLREKGEIPMTAMQLFYIALAAHIANKATKPTVKERLGIIMHRIKTFFSKPKAATTGGNN